MVEATNYVTRFSEAQVSEAIAHTQELWSGGKELSERVKRTTAELQAAGERFRFCGLTDEKGALLASLKRYRLQLESPWGPLSAIGIGAVFTPESLRGQGLATRLLKNVMDDARDDGIHVAFLFSDISPEFYSRLGFVAYPALKWTAPVEELPRDKGWSLRPASSQDESRLREWHELSFPAPLIRPLRDRFAWGFFRERQAGLEDFILEKNGEDVGYVTLNAGPAEAPLWVEEFAVKNDEWRGVWSVIAALAEARSKSKVSGWFRGDSLTSAFKSERRTRAIPMVAPLYDDLKLTGEEPSYFGSLDHF